ncbi:MAG: carboxypeptidase-like regulatory domain-containing protein [Saprospiraceae bacterium]|nr:carboxypeptidase-like regulatory domain-containing protein [Saprospiraceae bacterium]
MFLFISGSLFAQKQTTASGRVLDGLSGEALPFATVQFEGTSMGTTTDLDGHFKVTIEEPVKRLKVTYMGLSNRFCGLEKRPGKYRPGGKHAGSHQ